MLAIVAALLAFGRCMSPSAQVGAAFGISTLALSIAFAGAAKAARKSPLAPQPILMLVSTGSVGASYALWNHPYVVHVPWFAGTALFVIFGVSSLLFITVR